jgi:hypothetical protein
MHPIDLDPEPNPSKLRRIATRLRHVPVPAALAALFYTARTLCFSRVGLAWALGAATLLLLVKLTRRAKRKFVPRVSTGAFLCVALFSAGSLVHDFLLYGRCVICPSGSSKVTSGNYWGDFTVCKRDDDTRWGPAFGASYTEAGSSTDYYEEYRAINGRTVGVRVGCCYPFPCVEVCDPSERSVTCRELRLEPPLEWKGCRNLSAVVDQVFTHGCTVDGHACF